MKTLKNFTPVACCILQDLTVGILLALILFIVERYSYVNLTGAWEYTVTVDATSYSSFSGMNSRGELYLLQKGNEILGSGEKIGEKKPGEDWKIYEPKNRLELEVEGYLKRRYLFGNDELSLYIVQHGTIRKTRRMAFLKLVNNDSLRGTFLSTAANSRGEFEMRRILGSEEVGGDPMP